ncbi:MAG: transposase [Rhodospirillales bacterium]|nr:transposase [Rhodospirillales bacterium]
MLPRYGRMTKQVEVLIAGTNICRVHRTLLGDLLARGLQTPEILITDGTAGLETVLPALAGGADPELHRPQAPQPVCPSAGAAARGGFRRLHQDLRRNRERDRGPAQGLSALVVDEVAGAADSVKLAGDRLFTFTRLPTGQWRSARTSNAVEWPHEEFKRRIKTQTVPPSPETAAMLFWTVLAFGQIAMRKVDGWQTLATKPTDAVIDLAA